MVHFRSRIETQEIDRLYIQRAAAAARANAVSKNDPPILHKLGGDLLLLELAKLIPRQGLLL